MRLFYLGTLLITLFSVTLVQAAVEVKPTVNVDLARLKLGHVFSGIPTKKLETVIGKAPKPGKSYELTTQNLINIARMHNLDWQPNGVETVKVSRNSQVIDLNYLKPEVMDRVRKNVPFESFEVEFSTRDFLHHLPVDAPAAIEMGSLSFNARKDHFTLQVKVQGKQNWINGRVVELIQLPVLKATKERGERIEVDDLDWIQVPATTMTRNYLQTEAAVVGNAPKARIIKAYQPIRKTELISTNLVHKGDLVRVNLHNGNIRIQSQAKALQTGDVGSHINLMNPESKKVFTGTVVDGNTVNISITNPQVLNEGDEG